MNIRRFGYPAALFILLVSSLRPLLSLVALARSSDKYTHLLIIPALSFFFFVLKRKHIRYAPQPELLPGGILFCAGTTAMIVSFFIPFPRYPVLALSLQTISFLCAFSGITFVFFGISLFRSYPFPWLFLLFMVPLPSKVLALVITFFQYGSAEVVDLLLQATGVSYIREGLTFRLPSLAIFIAKECSGIRSSTALVITAVLAGHMMLRTIPGKVILIIAVAPLTLLKNGIRITTLTVLAEKIDTKWLTDSALHHRGGIVFFGIILVFFFGVLQIVGRIEKYISGRKERDQAAAGTSQKE